MRMLVRIIQEREESDDAEGREKRQWRERGGGGGILLESRGVGVEWQVKGWSWAGTKEGGVSGE